MIGRREAARLIDASMNDERRAALAEDVKLALYETASVAIHAMSRAQWVALAGTLYDELNADLDPLGREAK